MAEETQYTANTGMVTISTANDLLDGSGTLGTLLTGASNGTLIKTLTIKAQTDTTHGMIRFFVYNGANNRLLLEVDVPPITKSSVNKAFETKINLNFNLQSGYILKVSTQKAETFNVIAEGMNWAYYAPSVRADTTQLYANTGQVAVSTANSNLNGTGTLGTAYTAGSSPTYKGSSIRTITVKAIVNTTPGMVRLFLQDRSSNKYLFKEIAIPSVTKSATDMAFEHTEVFENDLDIATGYSVLASTQNAENFKITVEGLDWNYAS